MRLCERCHRRHWWYRGVCRPCHDWLQMVGRWDAWLDERDGVLDADSEAFDRSLYDWINREAA